MRLIKKIAAIMFAFMMVVSMSCNVKADEGTTATTGEKGTITINNAVIGQTYTIYKILDLESYDKTKNNYSYKPANGWETFIDQNDEYFIKNEYDGISWKASEGETEAQKQERASTLAKKALEYAKNPSNSITNSGTENAGSTTVTFSGLDLGYYLVDSSVGALCALNTTDVNMTIQEKNGQPTVEKKVSSTVDNGYGKSNDVNIGDTVYFQTIITAQAGAQDYVLHDTMDEGFTFTNNVQVKLNGSKVENQDYSIYLNDTENQDKTTDGCTFEIRFMKDFCDKLKEDDEIYVTYTATLNSKAFIGIKNDNEGSGNTNATKITYGANNKESVESKTQTYTYQIPVFKYTGIDKTHLAGATFSLFTTETEGDAIKLVQKTGTQEYRLAIQGETGEKEVTEITTTDTGRFSIQGLKPGNYWLEETAAPKGYNKLKKRIKIAVGAHGAIKIDGNYNADGTVSGGNLVAEVGVENKTGTVLPSTGGTGTTMIYLIGGALVLGSGVVLVTKRRVKGK